MPSVMHCVPGVGLAYLFEKAHVIATLRAPYVCRTSDGSSCPVVHLQSNSRSLACGSG